MAYTASSASSLPLSCPRVSSPSSFSGAHALFPSPLPKHWPFQTYENYALSHLLSLWHLPESHVLFHSLLVKCGHAVLPAFLSSAPSPASELPAHVGKPQSLPVLSRWFVCCSPDLSVSPQKIRPAPSNVSSLPR